jgi:hypothetical protein
MPQPTHSALIYGLTGQTLEVYPSMASVVRDGAPTSAATYAVYTGTQSLDESALFSGTATLDATATTFDAASGYSQTNRNKANLTATTSIVVGRRYLAANALSQREVVVPISIASADYVEVEEPLAYDYTTADTFKGLRNVFTIDADFIALESNINVYPGAGNNLANLGSSTSTSAPPYRVKWVITTAGGLVWHTWTTFDVVRQQAKSNLSIDDLRALSPDVTHHEWLNQRGQDFMPQLVEAEDTVRIDCRIAGFDPDQIRDAQLYRKYVLYRWHADVIKARLMSGADVGIMLEIAEKDYSRLMEKTLSTTLRAWVDTGTEGGITPEPARQLWFASR